MFLAHTTPAKNWSFSYVFFPPSFSFFTTPAAVDGTPRGIEGQTQGSHFFSPHTRHFHIIQRSCGKIGGWNNEKEKKIHKWLGEKERWWAPFIQQQGSLFRTPFLPSIPLHTFDVIYVKGFFDDIIIQMSLKFFFFECAAVHVKKERPLREVGSSWIMNPVEGRRERDRRIHFLVHSLFRTFLHSLWSSRTLLFFLYFLSGGFRSCKDLVYKFKTKEKQKTTEYSSRFLLKAASPSS